jgi:hypothetical protein
VHKTGRLDGTVEHIEQLSDVYYRGLMEVNKFINDYLEFERKEGSAI